jgi:methionyl aminopeptidase
MVIIKSEKEIGLMREGGNILWQIMGELAKLVVPGRNTHEIDELARKLIFRHGGTPVFEGYGPADNPYPAVVCVSLNSEIVHGIPRRDRIIQEGDIIKLDIGMKYKGLITDMARTFPAGTISPVAHKLMKTTQEGLDAGIATIKEGARLSDYSRAVDSYVRSRGFSIVRELVGHGVGRELHEDPQIPNYRFKGHDLILKEGMTLALEPMVNEGTHRIRLMSDGWTFVTTDGKLSCHFEDTVVVTKSGVQILTRK